MALTNFKTLSTEDKLAVLRTTAGLSQLNEWLSEGKSLRQIARLLDIDPKTMYRWRNTYANIAEVVAPYTAATVEAVMATPVLDLSRDAAYRIICNYEDHGTYIRGSIYDEHPTLQDLWSSPYMRDYFKFWGIDGSEYYESCLKATNNKTLYRLSHYVCIAYTKVTAKGKIIYLAPPTA